jgi:glutathione S-transferase
MAGRLGGARPGSQRLGRDALLIYEPADAHADELPVNAPRLAAAPALGRTSIASREIWRECRACHGGAGEFSAADAMFAPVISRIQTYDVELDGVEAEYAGAILALPAVREWIDAACDEQWSIPKFDEA